MKSNFFRFKILVTATFAFCLIHPHIHAQLTQVTENLLESTQIQYKRTTASPGEGTPVGRRVGAGSSGGECQIGTQQTPLVALVPEENTVDGQRKAVWGRTSQLSPTLWFYVAYPPNTHVLFALQDEQENPLYSTAFQIQSEKPDLVSVTIPSTEEIALEPGKKYLWYLYIMCAQKDSPDDFVNGWVEVTKANPELESQLQQATPWQRIKLYAENGFWYDALTQLEQLRSQQPGETKLDALWQDLLQQVGLGDISNAPVVQEH